MTQATSAAKPTINRNQRLWAILLVVDSFFVIIFGGALAAKIYQHWQAPAAELPALRQRRTPKPAAVKTEKPPEPAPTPAPAAEAPKPAAADKPGPPKPSLLHSAPAREAAKPHAAGAKAAAPETAPPVADAGKAAKALPTEFTIKAAGARSVELVGAFIVRGGKKAMISHPDGNWTLTLYLTPNTYRYWFTVNGKKTLDPQSQKTDRGASVLTVSAR